MMGRDDSSYFMNSAARSLIKLTLCVPIPCALCIACDVCYRYVIFLVEQAAMIIYVLFTQTTCMALYSNILLPFMKVVVKKLGALCNRDSSYSTRAFLFTGLYYMFARITVHRPPAVKEV